MGFVTLDQGLIYKTYKQKNGGITDLILKIYFAQKVFILLLLLLCFFPN